MKILWAVDAFDSNEKSLKQQWSQIKQFEAEVEAVYLLGPEQLDMPLAYDQTWFEYYKPLAEKALVTRVSVLEQTQKISIKVLPSLFSSQRQAVNQLLEYAKSSKFDLIFSGTNGRKGLQRAFLGSFAETLIIKSDIPVFTVGPEIQDGGSIKNAVFLTDLSQSSKVAFEKFLSQFQTYKPRVEILTAIPRPIEPVLQSGVYLLTGGWIPVPTYLEGEAGRIKKQGTEWAEFAKKQGFDAQFECVVGAGVVATVLEKIKKLNGFVALASQSNVLESALLGSVTREVVRLSTKPVWVVHPK